MLQTSWTRFINRIISLSLNAQLLFVMVGVCVLILGFYAPVSARDSITIIGSDTMLILNHEWASEYSQLNPSISFAVLGGGSERGIQALMNGETDIAASSRAMKSEELQVFADKTGSRPREIIVALDGIGIYVHNNNPISRLTISQLARILSGDIRNWNEVGGLNRRIDFYNRDINSGTRTFMQEHVLIDKSFTNLARDVSSSSILTSSVSRNQNAIGYSGIAYSQGARIIRLANYPDEVGVWPSHDNVSSGKYPLSRPLYFYVNPASMDENLRAFIDWTLSGEGQQVVKFVGYYPAPENQSQPEKPVILTQPQLQPQQSAKPQPKPNVNPVKLREPILLLPENIEELGFDMTIIRSDKGSPARPDLFTINLRFNTSGSSIERIHTILLRIGDDAVVPVSLDRSLSLKFSLRKPLIATSSIYLSEMGAPIDGEVYLIQLGDYFPVN